MAWLRFRAGAEAAGDEAQQPLGDSPSLSLRATQDSQPDGNAAEAVTDENAALPSLEPGPATRAISGDAHELASGNSSGPNEFRTGQI